MRASRGQPTAGNRPDLTRGVGDHGPVSYSRLDAGQSSDSERDNPHSATITHGSYSYKSPGRWPILGLGTGQPSFSDDHPRFVFIQIARPAMKLFLLAAVLNKATPPCRATADSRWFRCTIHGESDAKPCDSGFH